MPHCPVTVVQRYRDGVCSLLFHLFFIICHPYITLHLEEMIFLYLFYPFLTVPNAPSKTMLDYRCKREMLIPRFNAARGDRTRTAPLRRYATNLYAMPRVATPSRDLFLRNVWLRNRRPQNVTLRNTPEMFARGHTLNKRHTVY